MNKVFDIIVRVVFWITVALWLIGKFCPQGILATYRDDIMLVACIALFIMNHIDEEV